MTTTIHELKTWPAFYEAMQRGDKPFEARYNDRAYQRGDVLHLREWNPDTKEYTGRDCRKRVSYVLSGWGVQGGHVVLGLREVEPAALPFDPGYVHAYLKSALLHVEPEGLTDPQASYFLEWLEGVGK